MPEPRQNWVRFLLVFGAVLCIPGAVGVIVFAQGVAVLDTFQAAGPCATPSRDRQATCLSLFDGTVTELSPAGRGGSRVTVAVGDANVTVRTSGATFDPGSSVVTEWWKGQLVLLGPPGAPPTTITDQNPLQHLETFGLVLGLVIPGVSLLLAGVLVFQAPMSIDELITTTIARWPDPPRPVDRLVAWRVACGSEAIGLAFLGWVVLYVFPWQILELAINQPRYAPLFLVVTFVVSFGATAVLAAGNLFNLVRTSERRTIVVQKLQRGLGKLGNETKIWYELPDSRVATKLLNLDWDGHVSEGARLDVLANPKSGKILRMMSTPPA
jgi:hypothetical protein